MQTAKIDEIFTSIQGEGPWLGQRQIFVRFAGCDIACRYCDTPAAGQGGGTRTCRAQKTAAFPEREDIPASLSPEQLSTRCSRLIIPGPRKPVLSLTGGEPLLQHSFLSVWLPQVKSTYTIYLETNGIHHRQMKSLTNVIDIVSMDFKLPTATGLRSFWDEHKKFLAACRETKLFVKAVVTAGSSREDILMSARLIAEYDATVPLIIQPAGGPFAPESAVLVDFQNAALGVIEDVRIIPQAHKMLNLP